jgi:RNA polymerase sigma factor (sigma-70 family)
MASTAQPRDAGNAWNSLTAERPGYWLAAARPRLVRIARSWGIDPDTAEDVAQETLLEAWRHLDELYAPSVLDAWLKAICRNVCRRYARADGQRARRLSALPVPMSGDEPAGSDEASQPDILDPYAFDPAEELERQDLETLLDRALGHLSLDARAAVELCYLAEIPQREAAVRLGLTIRALEARLHRARAQLRRVLGGELRADAETFGLAVGDGLAADEVAAGWRETHLWCRTCGRSRRQGVLEPLPAGGVRLHLRCPSCLRHVDTQGIVPLRGTRSFLPAWKRLMQYTSASLTRGVTTGWQACPFCGSQQQRVRVVRPDEVGDRHGKVGLKVLMQCGACGEHLDMPVGALVAWPHPEAQRFMARHPRWIQEPDVYAAYRGYTGIRVGLADVASTAHLTLLAHSQTLEVLAAFDE